MGTVIILQKSLKIVLYISYIFEDLLCKKYSDIENTPADMQFYQIKCNIINYNYTKNQKSIILKYLIIKGCFHSNQILPE